MGMDAHAIMNAYAAYGHNITLEQANAAAAKYGGIVSRDPAVQASGFEEPDRSPPAAFGAPPVGGYGGYNPYGYGGGYGADPSYGGGAYPGGYNQGYMYQPMGSPGPYSAPPPPPPPPRPEPVPEEGVAPTSVAENNPEPGAEPENPGSSSTGKVDLLFEKISRKSTEEASHEEQVNPEGEKKRARSNDEEGEGAKPHPHPPSADFHAVEQEKSAVAAGSD